MLSQLVNLPHLASGGRVVGRTLAYLSYGQEFNSIPLNTERNLRKLAVFSTIGSEEPICQTQPRTIPINTLLFNFLFLFKKLGLFGNFKKILTIIKRSNLHLRPNEFTPKPFYVFALKFTQPRFRPLLHLEKLSFLHFPRELSEKC
jgi:hypothetical protein